MSPDPIGEALRHFGVDGAHLEAVPESYSSTVRRIILPSGECLILKIPYARHKLLRELTALEALQHDLPVPKVVDAWIPEGEGCGAMLLSHLPGRIIEEPVTPVLAHELGELLARLHAHRLPWHGEVFEPANPAEQDWWDVMRKRFQDWLRSCEGVVDAGLIQDIRAAHSVLSDGLPRPDGPCWVHADFRPANVLIESHQQITGLIDFESARGGSADYDFVKMSLEVWDAVPGTEEAFLRGYDNIRQHPDVSRSLAFYQLHNAVGGLAWCIRRTDTHDPFYEENITVVYDILNEKGLHRRRYPSWRARSCVDH